MQRMMEVRVPNKGQLRQMHPLTICTQVVVACSCCQRLPNRTQRQHSRNND